MGIIVAMMMAATVVGARLGIEWRLVILESGAEPFGQGLQHMVRREAHETAAFALSQRQLHMAVARW